MANILVVDDDPIACQVVKDVLRTQAHYVFAATDWSSMNEELFKRPYAVVVLDVNLPGLKGDKLAAIVNRNLDPRPKIVLHSSLDEAELRKLTRLVGAVNYLPKGCSEAQMLRVVGAAARAYAEENPPA